MNEKLKEEFNILNNDDIALSPDLQSALELINQENIVTEIDPPEVKKFAVIKKDEAKKMANISFDEKSEIELDEIAEQADQSFYALMNIAVNSTGKGCADIASAANSFLNVKLNSKIAKMDSHMKKLQYELNKQKFEATIKTIDASETEEDDGIVIIENN